MLTRGLGILVFGALFSAFMGWWHRQQWYGKHRHSDGRPKLSWEQARDEREAKLDAEREASAKIARDLMQHRSSKDS